MTSLSLIAPAAYEKLDEMMWPHLLRRLNEIVPGECSVHIRYEAKQTRVENADGLSVAEVESVENALRESMKWARKTCNNAFPVAYG